MNQRDQELLDKQLHAVIPGPRHEGALALAILAIFLAGMTIGGFLTAVTDEAPLRVASNDAGLVAAPPTAPPILRP